MVKRSHIRVGILSSDSALESIIESKHHHQEHVDDASSITSSDSTVVKNQLSLTWRTIIDSISAEHMQLLQPAVDIIKHTKTVEEVLAFDHRNRKWLISSVLLAAIGNIVDDKKVFKFLYYL